MLAFFTLATSVLLFSVGNVATAQDGGGLSGDQQCLLTCSTDAAKASGCQLGDNACFCSSTVYINQLTDCSTSTCSFTADQVKGFLADGCGGASSGSASAAPSGSGPASNPSKSAAAGGSSGLAPASGSAPAPSQSGNSAPFSGVRTETGSLLAAGVVLYTLFV